MRVFKGYLLLLKRNSKMTLLYLVVFFGLITLMGRLQSEKGAKAYASEKVDTAVINRDGSVLADGIYDYVKENHNVVEIGDSEKEIQSALYYRRVKYVIIIPRGYQEQFIKGDAKLETVKLPDSDSARYLDAQTDTFLNSVNVYYKSGYSIQEAVDHARKQSGKSGEVTMIDKNGNGGIKEKYVFLFQYFPYMIIAVLGYSVSTVLIRSRSKEIKMRMLCSSVTPLRQNLEGIAMFVMAGLAIWGFVMLALLVLYGGRFALTPNKWYFIINSLMMLIAALAIAFLLGILIKKEQILSGAVNTISLGMSFLCGVFVPLEMLGSGVRKVVQFLPVYWYETINEMLGQYQDLSAAMKQTMWKGFAVQFTFAAACICVALMVSRMQRQEK